MIGWWVLGCGVSESSLTSLDRSTRIAALDALPSWQAQQLVPRLEKWATLSSEGRADVSDAALRALIRADSESALAVIVARLDRPGDPAVLRALRAETPNRRVCEQLVARWERGEVRQVVCEVRASDGLPCSASVEGQEAACPSR